MPPRTPHFSLVDVKAIAKERDGLRLSRTKAEASFSTPMQALVAAKAVIEGLTEKDFVEVKHQNPDVCDVYAVVFDARGWYVKFTLVPDQVLLISLHPLEHPIRTARGHEVKP